jgi:hypothetical protein
VTSTHGAASNTAHERYGAHGFVIWAVESGHLSRRLEIRREKFNIGPAITQQRRLTLLRKYLTDDQEPVAARVAACLLLLYALPISRILRLTRDDLLDAGDELLLRLGDPPTPVPDPLAPLLRRLAAAAPPPHGWLFPGPKSRTADHAPSGRHASPHCDNSSSKHQHPSSLPPSASTTPARWCGCVGCAFHRANAQPFRHPLPSRRYRGTRRGDASLTRIDQRPTRTSAALRGVCANPAFGRAAIQVTDCHDLGNGRAPPSRAEFVRRSRSTRRTRQPRRESVPSWSRCTCRHQAHRCRPMTRSLGHRTASHLVNAKARAGTALFISICLSQLSSPHDQPT